MISSEQQFLNTINILVSANYAETTFPKISNIFQTATNQGFDGELVVDFIFENSFEMEIYFNRQNTEIAVMLGVNNPDKRLQTINNILAETYKKTIDKKNIQDIIYKCISGSNSSVDSLHQKLDQDKCENLVNNLRLIRTALDNLKIIKELPHAYEFKIYFEKYSAIDQEKLHETVGKLKNASELFMKNLTDLQKLFEISSKALKEVGYLDIFVNSSEPGVMGRILISEYRAAQIVSWAKQNNVELSDENLLDIATAALAGFIENCQLVI